MFQIVLLSIVFLLCFVFPAFAEEKEEAKLEEIVVTATRIETPVGSTPASVSVVTKEKIELKETDYFKYYDYIEGVGLDESVSKIVFSLAPGEIYPEPLMVVKGAYIVQLKSFSEFDEKDFREKKEKYAQILSQREYFLKKLEFLGELQKESNLTIYANPQQ